MSKYNGINGAAEKDTDRERLSSLSVAALKYDKDKHNAPCVVAAGTGYIAQKILQVAIENGVAIYHDDSAATLLAKLELGQEIPPELYQIVVNIYISLMDLAEEKKRKTGY
jgi:flagellar biosynthesis protein